MFSATDVRDVQNKVSDVKLSIVGFENLSAKQENPDYAVVTLTNAVLKICDYVIELRRALDDKPGNG